MSNTLPGRALDIPVPPQLEAAVEYHGTARYFGLYWTPSGDEVVVTDGRSAHDGCWWGYQAFVDHPLSLIPLAGQRYHLGSSDEPATHWLIIDRQTRLISIAPAGEALRFLNAQHPPLLRTQLTAEEWRAAIEAAHAQLQANLDRVNSIDVRAALERQNAVVSDMSTWLDQRLPQDWQALLIKQLEGIPQDEERWSEQDNHTSPDCATG